jgi:hypothetical protein
MKIEARQICEIVKNSLPIGFILGGEEGVIIDFNSQAVETNIKQKNGELIKVVASIAPIFDEDQNFI